MEHDELAGLSQIEVASNDEQGPLRAHHPPLEGQEPGKIQTGSHAIFDGKAQGGPKDPFRIRPLTLAERLEPLGEGGAKNPMGEELEGILLGLAIRQQGPSQGTSPALQRKVKASIRQGPFQGHSAEAPCTAALQGGAQERAALRSSPGHPQLQAHHGMIVALLEDHPQAIGRAKLLGGRGRGHERADA